MPAEVPPNQWIGYVVGIAIAAFVLTVRARRLRRERPLKLERLWIFPTLYLVLASVMLFEFPPRGLQWAYCVAALAIGGVLGWQRGRMMRITVDPATHALNQRASPAAILFIIALIAVRAGARGLVGPGGGPLHLNALVVTDMLVVMALGLFSAQRIEMYLRARKLLEAARV
ncbi:MAG: cytochrome c biogenesis protein CcdC [Sphingomonas sp.]|nr:cytochrome c biogenesis protein CcdC [Sphingomonas sp.]